MLTKIFHPNMSKSGEICVDTLKKGWKKEYGVGHVLVVRQARCPLASFPAISWKAGIAELMSIRRPSNAC